MLVGNAGRAAIAMHVVLLDACGSSAAAGTPCDKCVHAPQRTPVSFTCAPPAIAAFAHLHILLQLKHRTTMHVHLLACHISTSHTHCSNLLPLDIVVVIHHARVPEANCSQAGACAGHAADLHHAATPARQRLGQVTAGQAHVVAGMMIWSAATNEEKVRLAAPVSELLNASD
jgi:hypothetical protein